jgi:hypothetical protein
VATARRSGKSCAWNGVFLGSRRGPDSPAAIARPAACGSRAQLGAGLGRAWLRALGAVPRSSPPGLVCGAWVTPATDVSCISDLAAFLWAAQ